MENSSSLRKLNDQVLESGLCAACGACVSRCPYLIKFKGKTIKLDSCTVENGRCYSYCPMTFFDEDAISRSVFSERYDSNGIGKTVDISAGRSLSEEIRSIAQGGGVVTSLVMTALEEGIADAAVLTVSEQGDDYPRGVVVTDAKQVVKAAGSKFVGAHSLEALKEAIEKGFNKIAVVGLPCQVRALRKMALMDIKNENLLNRISLVIGLFCNWALSVRELLPFLSDRLGSGKIRKYDIPPPPANVMVVVTDEGTMNIPLDDIRALTQESCKSCGDMTSEFADVSVGMYEGKPGWNTVIVRTPKGQALLNKAMDGGILELEEFPEANLTHLRNASIRKKDRARSR